MNRQSRPDSAVGFQIAVLEPFQGFPSSIVSGFIWHEVFLNHFCRSQLPHKSGIVSFTITVVKKQLTDLCGNWLLQSDFENTLCEMRSAERESSLDLWRQTVNLRRSERARNEGSVGPKRLDDTRWTTYRRRINYRTEKLTSRLYWLLLAEGVEGASPRSASERRGSILKRVKDFPLRSDIWIKPCLAMMSTAQHVLYCQFLKNVQ